MLPSPTCVGDVLVTGCFSVYLGKVTAAEELPSKAPSSLALHMIQSYRCMQCFSVYLGKVTAAVVPSPTGVRNVLVFTWVRLQQPQEQCHGPISVCDVLVFTWAKLQLPKGQCYPILC